MFNTVDAATLAAQFATLEVSAARERYSIRTDRIDDQRVGLDSLKTALSTFEDSIGSAISDSAPLLSSKATLSDKSFFDVDVGANALATSYSIFTQQLAQRHTVSTTAVGNDSVGDVISGASELPQFGVISFALQDTDGNDRTDADGNPIPPLTIDLSTDLPAGSTLNDLVDYVNQSTANPGVTLSLVNGNGQLSLLASSTVSGEDANIVSAFTEDGLDPTPADNDWLEQLFTTGNQVEITAAQNAIIKLGSETSGLSVESNTNTFSNIFDDVSITVNAVMATGTQPVDVEIAQDKSATRSKLNNIVESYNTLMANFDFLLASGGEDTNRGSLADFAAIKSMKRQISNQFRNEYDGRTLFSVGLEIDSKGKMLINGSRFDQAYDEGPEVFEAMLTGDQGLLSSVDDIVSAFTGITGSVQSKLDYTQQQLDIIDKKLIGLDEQYDRQYQRYLQQFTSLNAVIDQMNTTSGLFSL